MSLGAQIVKVQNGRTLFFTVYVYLDVYLSPHDLSDHFSQCTLIQVPLLFSSLISTNICCNFIVIFVFFYTEEEEVTYVYTTPVSIFLGPFQVFVVLFCFCNIYLFYNLILVPKRTKLFKAVEEMETILTIKVSFVLLVCVKCWLFSATRVFIRSVITWRHLEIINHYNIIFFINVSFLFHRPSL